MSPDSAEFRRLMLQIDDELIPLAQLRSLAAAKASVADDRRAPRALDHDASRLWFPMPHPRRMARRLHGPYGVTRTDLQAMHEALGACQRALAVQSRRVAALQAQLARLLAKQRSH